MAWNKFSAKCSLCLNLEPLAFRAFTLDEAQSSAANGCDVCRLLVCTAQTLQPQWGHLYGSDEEAGDFVGFVLWEPASLTWPPGPPARLRLSMRYPKDHPHYRWIPSEAEKDDGRGNRGKCGRSFCDCNQHIGLNITSTKDNALPWGRRLATSNRIANYSESNEAFQVLQDWINECVCHHSGCAEDPIPLHTSWPKRLINIGDGKTTSKLRLTETRDGVWPYIALSYSWGGQQPFMATQETYELLLDGFRIEDLSEAFQDAVRICWKLHIRFLWIDALCIIQHDRADWEEEVPRMGAVYGNAYLVIAAAVPKNPTESIFSQRPPSYDFEFTLDDKTYAIRVKEKLSHDLWFLRQMHVLHGEEHSYTDPKLPLLGRGWAYQERLLARRIVHYTDTELIWECRSSSKCECTGMNWELGRPEVLPRSRISRLPTKVAYANLHLIAQKLQSGQQIWNSVVEQYSARKFTHTSDRLPAFSSLARRFHELVPEMGTYLAGIWSNTLPHSLVWWSVSETGARGTEPHLPFEQCRAPSWSWASCAQEVECRINNAAELEFVGAHCTPETVDSYGAVSDAYIIVEGQLCEHPGMSKVCFQDTLVSDPGDWAESDEAEPLFLLKLNHWFSGWDVMVLRRSDRVHGAFERVRVRTLGWKDIFEGVERTIIKLV